MPPAPVSPDRLLALGRALAPLRECAHTGVDDVLGLYPEVGAPAPQASVEACLDQVADLLRALDSATGEVADQLRVAASSVSDTAYRETRSIDPRSIHAGSLDAAAGDHAVPADARWQLR
jgi:hypothetical protein